MLQAAGRQPPCPPHGARQYDCDFRRALGQRCPPAVSWAKAHPGGLTANGCRRLAIDARWPPEARLEHSERLRRRQISGTFGVDRSFSIPRLIGISARDTSGLGFNQDDFLSVAEHEISHTLGFGARRQVDQLSKRQPIYRLLLRAQFGGKRPHRRQRRRGGALGRQHCDQGTAGLPCARMDPILPTGRGPLLRRSISQVSRISAGKCRANSGRIQGTVFEDLNGNGAQIPASRGSVIESYSRTSTATASSILASPSPQLRPTRLLDQSPTRCHGLQSSSDNSNRRVFVPAQRRPLCANDYPEFDLFEPKTSGSPPPQQAK